MPEHETAAPHTAPADEVGAFLRRRREQLAQRWADEALFRTVFTVSRDEAVEAGRLAVDALAQVAECGRVQDPESTGFTLVREQLARMAAALGRQGLPPSRVSTEVDALRVPAVDLLIADLTDAPAPSGRGSARPCWPS